MSEPTLRDPWAGAPAGAGQTILYIEDDPQVHAITVRQLTMFHYRVIPTTNVQEALQLWQASRSQIRAVISDRDLGSARDGISLLLEFSEQDPKLVVVLTSGNLTPELIASLHRTTRIRCLTKPFNFRELLTLLHEGLKAHAR